MVGHSFHCVPLAAVVSLNLIRNQLIHVYYVYDDFDEHSAAVRGRSTTVRPTMIASDDRMVDTRSEATRRMRTRSVLA